MVCHELYNYTSYLYFAPTYSEVKKGTWLNANLIFASVFDYTQARQAHADIWPQSLHARDLFIKFCIFHVRILSEKTIKPTLMSDETFFHFMGKCGNGSTVDDCRQWLMG